jgi:hypothetical protein
MAPNAQIKMRLETASIAKSDATEQFVTSFRVAPMGGMSLKGRGRYLGDEADTV